MYYVIEHNIRPNGVVNVSETGRSTFALGLNYYYERCSKAVVNEAFVTSHVMLVDENLEVIKVDHLAGLYEEPKEVEPEPIPEPEPEVEPNEESNENN